MTQKKNIIVCWNDNGYKEILNNAFIYSKNYSVSVFSNFESFYQLGKTDQERKRKLKEYDGFVVLCELQWNHEKTDAPYVEFQGITFVQRYLRDMGLKAPVVFASFIDAKDIVDSQLSPQLRPDGGIIMTPALQHRFVRLPAQPEELLNPFEEMRLMSDTELVYTQMQYCNFDGFLGQIKHSAEGRKKEEQRLFRDQIRYVVDKLFKGVTDYQELIQKTESEDDLSAFCEELINRRKKTKETPKVADSIDSDFARQYESEQLRTLILEDDANDIYVNKFVSYIKKQNEFYEQAGKLFLFQNPVVVQNEKSFITRLRHFDPHVIICDIEIRMENYLTSLGFNVAKEASKSKTKPLYYIITKVTRSFYDQIKMENVRRIRLKSEVFGTEDSIGTFLYGIKEVYEQRQEEANNSEKKCERIFKKLYNYIKDEDGYQFDYLNNENGTVLYTLTTFDEIETVVRNESEKLIKRFLSLFKDSGFYTTNPTGMKENNFQIFNSQCAIMRDSINLLEPNAKIFDDLFESNKPDKDPTNEQLEKFTVRLILRRFFLYVRKFLEYYNIMESVNYYKKQKADNRKHPISDIACRAISIECKAIEGEKEYREQNHCYDKILLLSWSRNPERLTDEETAFLKCLENSKNPFDFEPNRIKKLKFNY